MKKESKGEVVIYEAEDGKTTLEVNLQQDTVWLNTHQMASLFQRDRTVIVRHIRNIYKTDELLRDSTCAKIAQVAKDGKKRVMDFYNLDMIISVGYRVNSLRGTQFTARRYVLAKCVDLTVALRYCRDKGFPP